MLRQLLVLFCLISVFAAAPAGAQEKNAAAVGIAGEQRMLSQRIAKAYAQIGLNVMPETAAGEMQEAIARFEANLERLHEPAAASAQAGRALARLRQTWTGMRGAAAAPVSRPAAIALSHQSLEVLAAADALAQSLEDAAGPGASRLVNMSGRLRMLSQRVVKVYLLLSWGFDAAAVRDEADAAATEFSGRLAALMAQPQNTPEIRSELGEIALQWEWLQTALAAEGALSYRLVVAEAGEAILAATDRVTLHYQQLGSR